MLLRGYGSETEDLAALWARRLKTFPEKRCPCPRRVWVYPEATSALNHCMTQGYELIFSIDMSTLEGKFVY